MNKKAIDANTKIARMQREIQQSKCAIKTAGSLAAMDTIAILVWLCTRHPDLDLSNISQDSVSCILMLADMAFMAVMLRNYWQIANNRFDIKQLRQRQKTK